MSGVLFQEIMRGDYIQGAGYRGWTEESAKPYLVEFSKVLPKISDAILKRNTSSYTLTWTENKEAFKALFTLEEDAFGGPTYREGNIVILSAKVESKPQEKAAKKEKSKAGDKKGKASKEKKPTASWKGVENQDLYKESHIIPLFYHICLQAPPKGIVFL